MALKIQKCDICKKKQKKNQRNWCKKRWNKIQNPEYQNSKKRPRKKEKKRKNLLLKQNKSKHAVSIMKARNILFSGYLVFFCLELTPLEKAILGSGCRSTQFWIGEHEERRFTSAWGAEG